MPITARVTAGAHERAVPGDDDSLDLYARMVRRAVRVPVALVSLVQAERQVFPGAVGLPADYQRSRETPLTHSFCQYVVRDQQPLIVSDAREVDWLATNLAIEDLDVIAYAGWPLTDHTGAVVGSLCAIDSEPRVWTDVELESLADIATACSAELIQRGRRDAAVRGRDEAERLAERSRALLALSEALSGAATLPEIAQAVGRVAREQLGADRAGVWLLDDPGGTVDAWAAGDRITLVPDSALPWDLAEQFAVLPVDHTSALGSALMVMEPLYLSPREALDARFPEAKGLAPMGEAHAFIPLAMMSRPVGVLAISWTDAREFAEDDQATITALTAYTAQAVQRAALLQERVDTSVTLQRAMLTELPAVPGLQLAARYLPAGQRDQVGGDWYDAIVLPSGATMVTVGDVVGHDIAAAAVMGQLRSMLRGIVCTLDETPAQSLTRLDIASTRLGVGSIASLLLAHLVPLADGRWRLRWSSAGHLPALVMDPSGTVTDPRAEPTNDCLIGVEPSRPRRDREVELESGSVLLLYTDGLVERRREPIDEGIERLRDALGRQAAAPLDALLDQVLADLVGDDHDDDVAVLAVRLVGPG